MRIERKSQNVNRAFLDAIGEFQKKSVVTT
jgi:hypothetical protein